MYLYWDYVLHVSKQREITHANTYTDMTITYINNASLHIADNNRENDIALTNIGQQTKTHVRNINNNYNYQSLGVVKLTTIRYKNALHIAEYTNAAEKI
jgi:hypothetical protein